jgi:YtfJ family uncharacterized protein
MTRCLIACLFVFFAQSALSQVKLGQPLPEMSLSGDSGGRVNGQPWTSSELKGKVNLLFYVDPDHKGDNPALEKALEAEKFPEDRFQSTAVINMAATWLPNAAIASSLKSKQKDYPRTVYVKDLQKSLVKNWGLDDNSYVVLMLDKSGMPAFYKAGPLSQSDIDQLITLIKQNL